MKTFPVLHSFRISMPSGGSYLGGSDDGSLEGALANAFEVATYYVALHGKAKITIMSSCAECRGSGRVPRARQRYAYKACPACKGRGEHRDVHSFAVKAHECVALSIVPAA